MKSSYQKWKKNDKQSNWKVEKRNEKPIHKVQQIWKDAQSLS